MNAEDAAKFELAAAIREFEVKARSLQIHLQAEGLYKGEIDGDWGPQSRAALRRYQKRRTP
jgi:hypothetical protein